MLHLFAHTTSPADESVSKNLSAWIENYLLYVQTADHYVALGSYLDHRDLWQTIPELVVFMANRRWVSRPSRLP